MLYPALKASLLQISVRAEEIAEPRKAVLNEIAQFAAQQTGVGDGARLIFICTHNSRRSHLAHIWASVAIHHFGLAKRVHTFSGGTEATAFHPNAVTAVKQAGFVVEDRGGDNPHYLVKIGDKISITCFSKIYDDPCNPQAQFAAVMTCSGADENCPYIPGAIARFKLPYEDPKIADGTPHAMETYVERSAQIAAEMYYWGEQVKKFL